MVKLVQTRLDWSINLQICNAIPPSCIQMRNLILSAFPRNMRLPDPFTPNLRPEMLPEISATPMFRPPSKQLLTPQIRDEVACPCLCGPIPPSHTMHSVG